MTTKLEKVRNLLDFYNNQRIARTNRRIQLAEDFLTHYIDLKRSLESIGDPKFNAFKIVKLGHDEVRHSAILGWLLNAKGDHGQKALFLEAFLAGCKINLPLTDLVNYKVRQEFSGRDAIIDVMVYKKNHFLIFIENKVYSPEGDKQCAREFGDMNRLGDSLHIPDMNRFTVFLTPEGEAPKTDKPEHWIVLSYKELGDVLKQKIPSVTSSKVLYALEDWLEIISEF